MEHSNAPVTGTVFNIQHFCTDDGPGIRTTVFLKGCPLRCAWCHNPESNLAVREIMFRADRCRLCGACTKVCEASAHVISSDGKHVLDRTRCVRCGKCSDACLFEALETVGSEKTVNEVLKELLSDRIFYETSGGGVTVSGGEPTAQPDFTEALLAACKGEGLHTAMETAGYCKKEVLMRLCPHTDLFLFDWKLSDEEAHKRYTGVSNLPIKENLALLDSQKKPVILRCPLIPNVNDNTEHLDGIALLEETYSCIQAIDLEPYHPMGIGKANALGRTAPYSNESFLEKESTLRMKEYLQARVKIPVRAAT